MLCTEDLSLAPLLLNFGEGCAPRKKVNTANKSPTKLKMLLLKLNVVWFFPRRCTHNGKHLREKGSHVGDSSELFGRQHRKSNCKELALSYIQLALGSKLLWFQYFQRKMCYSLYSTICYERSLQLQAITT